MLESIKYTLIPVEEIPEAAKKPLNPETPTPLKLMAAKGLLPMPKDAQLCVWYQLSLQGDESIVSAVRDTIKSFDENILVEMAKSVTSELLLDWLAKATNINAVIEAVILNAATSDATFMDLALVVTRDLADLIAANHNRLLRSPVIVEKLYQNPETRMATVDKLLALLKEHAVDVSAFKMLQDAIKANEADDGQPKMDDEEFAQILAQAAKDSAKEDVELKLAQPALHDVKSIDDEQSEESEEKQKKRLSRQQIIDKMNAPQRVRLAIVGTREDRTILLRDTRRIVYMSVITSPKMSIAEASSLAASKSMPDDVIGYIAKRRDWVRSYPIVVSLVNNPKCPLGEALSFIKQLRVNDLKLLMRSKSVSATVVRQATQLYRQKQT